MVLPGLLVMALGIGLPALAVLGGEIEEATTAGYIAGGAYILLMVGGGLLMVILGVQSFQANNRRSRLLETGVKGDATVLSATQTGFLVNKQPQVELELRIETPVHGAYEVTSKQVVPFIYLSTLTAGYPLAVRVDRRDREAFTIDWEAPGARATEAPGVDASALLQSLHSLGAQGVDTQAISEAISSAGLTGDGATPPWASPAEREAARRRILASGEPATATVLASTPAGETDAEGQPVFLVTLFIQGPSGVPTQGSAKVGVPLERVRRLQVGEQLPIRVDPEIPAAMAVDWDRV